MAYLEVTNLELRVSYKPGQTRERIYLITDDPCPRATGVVYLGVRIVRRIRVVRAQAIA